MDIVQKPSPNNWSLEKPIKFIVLHTTLGAFDGAVSWLRNPGSGVSAHYVVSREGEVAQLVQLNRGAWHAGNINNPTARAQAVMERKYPLVWRNPNRYSIGIEFAAGYDIDKDGVIEDWEQLYTVEQAKAAAELILHIEKELGRRFSNDEIITHKDIASYKPNLEKQRVMVLSALDNLRNEQPSTQPMLVYKNKKKPEIYFAVGNRLVHIDSSFEEYQQEFPGATIVELDDTEFKKFVVTQFHATKQ